MFAETILQIEWNIDEGDYHEISVKAIIEKWIQSRDTVCIKYTVNS